MPTPASRRVRAPLHEQGLCNDYGIAESFTQISIQFLKTNALIFKRYDRSNQAIKPTQHFVVSFRLMRRPIVKVLGGLSLCR
jgi:hypothetical protein